MNIMLEHELQKYPIPEHIQTELRKLHETAPSNAERIGQPNYTAPEPTLVSDAIIALSLGKNVLLKGPTGAGKTRLAELLSYLFNRPMQAINCSVDLDAEALLGYKTLSYDAQNHAHIQFIPGPVEISMTEGHFLYIDEINMAKAETLPILNGVLDHRKQVLNPFTSQTIRAKPQFGVIAAINEGYIGTTPLNEALQNRFVVIEVPYLQDEALFELLKVQSQLKDEKLLKGFIILSHDLLSKIQEGQIAEEAGSIRSLLDACDLATSIPARRAIKRAIIDKLDDEREKTAVQDIAETIFT